MDSKYLGDLILLIILLMGSAFFSASETALMSLSKLRLKHMVEEKRKGALNIERLLENPQKMLVAILVGNNVVNIWGSAIATALAIKLYSNGGIGVATAVMTIVILIFGEITPKTLAVYHSEGVSLKVAPIIGILVKLLSPIIYIMTKITNFVVRLSGGSPSDKKPFITEDELKTIVDVSSKEGLLENEEKEMIYNIFEFGDLRIKDIMVQRQDISSVSVDSNYDEVIEEFKKEKFSRLPVYEENIDNIVGIVYLKDFILLDQSKEDFDLRKIMRQPNETFEFMKIADIYKDFQLNRVHMAVVLDEYGGVAGIVTMEDIVESIMGDIQDEYDEEEEDIQVIKEDEYLVLGETKLDDLNSMIGTNLESEDFDSVGGFVIGLIGRLPKKGEVVEYQGIKFIIESIDKNRIEKIRIYT